MDVRIGPETQRSICQLLTEVKRYAGIRRELLRAVGRQASQRDPFTEVAERIAELYMGGTRSANRNQKGWDLAISDDGPRVQVKCLANASEESWVNEHPVRFPVDAKEEGVNIYALLIIEAFEIKHLVLFFRAGLPLLHKLLGKKHGESDTRLELTRKNYRQILDHRDDEEYSGLVQVLDMPLCSTT